LPLLERVRVEVYLPDPHLIEYDNLLRSFEEEFTYIRWLHDRAWS